MRSFVAARTLDPVPAAVVRRCREIDRGRGLEALFQQHHPEALERLAARARVESVISSSEIEGVVVGRNRAERILGADLEPKDRDEYELAGYNAALDEVFANADASITVPRLLAWHRALFSHLGPDAAGHFKVHENRVVDRQSDGTAVDRFLTVRASDTPFAVAELVDRAEAALQSEEHHPVFVTAAFVLDLLTIHPFEDGNGRVARIATTAMLMRAGYRQCRYVPIERLIDERSTEYYRALAESTAGWHESEHSIWPWTEFLTGVLAEAQRVLETQLAELGTASAVDLVEDWLDRRAPSSFRAIDAERALPMVSRASILRVLRSRREQGQLVMEGRGPSTRWRIKRG